MATIVLPDTLAGARTLRIARLSYSFPFLTANERVRLRDEWVFAPVVIIGKHPKWNDLRTAPVRVETF